jgi:hypothetical protein
MMLVTVTAMPVVQVAHMVSKAQALRDKVTAHKASADRVTALVNTVQRNMLVSKVTAHKALAVLVTVVSAAKVLLDKASVVQLMVRPVLMAKDLADKALEPPVSMAKDLAHRVLVDRASAHPASHKLLVQTDFAAHSAPAA